MILETAFFSVPTDQRSAFESGLDHACALFARTPGYVRHEIRCGLEEPDTSLLLVWWETLESHTVNFRNSPAFSEWRAYIRPHYSGSAVVKHYRRVG